MEICGIFGGNAGSAVSVPIPDGRFRERLVDCMYGRCRRNDVPVFVCLWQNELERVRISLHRGFCGGRGGSVFGMAALLLPLLWMRMGEILAEAGLPASYFWTVLCMYVVAQGT